MAELTTWKTEEMNRLRRDMGSMFDRVWEDFGMELALPYSGGIDAVELMDRGNSLVLRAKTPEIDPRDLAVRVSEAVTGSVNQKGEIQAIGGVNMKVEGFYDCCTMAGLTGKQGVMIPQANIKDLMLRKDVVEAVTKGQFHVWSVGTVDQGMEILTGKPAGKMKADGTYTKGSINDLADRKLRRLAEGLKRFGNSEPPEEKGGKKAKKTSPSGKKRGTN